MKITRFLVALALCLGIANLNYLQAQETAKADGSVTLKKVLKKNRYPIGYDSKGLTQEGGQWLRKKTKEANFITIGENHGTKEIPRLISALIKDLKQAEEFDQLAIEVSPWTARQLENKLRDSKEAYSKFMSAYTAAVPFYNWKVERGLLRQAVSGSEDGRKIVGMDQIFSFSTQLALDRLKNIAPNDTIKSKINDIEKELYNRLEKDPELQRLPESMPFPVTMFNPSTIDTLQLWFDGIPKANTLLDEIERSIEIYKLNNTDNYRSNQMRAQLMRKNLSHAIEAYATRKDSVYGYVIKTGAMHAYKGITPNNALDVGNLVESIADMRGGEAFNVAILCGPGSKGRGFPSGTGSCWSGLLGEELKNLSKDNTVLFDLTSVHPVLHKNEINPPKELEKFLWAFDAVVLIPDATPASFIHPLKK